MKNFEIIAHGNTSDFVKVTNADQLYAVSKELGGALEDAIAALENAFNKKDRGEFESVLDCCLILNGCLKNLYYRTYKVSNYAVKALKKKVGTFEPRFMQLNDRAYDELGWE